MFNDFSNDHPVYTFIGHLLEALWSCFRDFTLFGSLILIVGAIWMIRSGHGWNLSRHHLWDEGTLSWLLLVIGLVLLALTLWWHWPHPNWPAQPTNFHF